jgi:hypothetical protein
LLGCKQQKQTSGYNAYILQQADIILSPSKKHLRVLRLGNILEERARNGETQKGQRIEWVGIHLPCSKERIRWRYSVVLLKKAKYKLDKNQRSAVLQGV